MEIYLDVCCLNRPYDDQSQDKIRMESEAVITILNRIEEKKLYLVSSDIVKFEISKILDPERKRKVTSISRLSSKIIKLNKNIINRAKEIEKTGISAMDALHLASAEFGKIEIFLTTDQELIKIVNKNKNDFKIEVKNPLNWMMEVIE